MACWKIAANHEPQTERRTPQKTKDDYLAAFLWQRRATELTAVCSTYGWG
jgi:hypothetical protein